MSHITSFPLRKPARYFGQDCLVEKIAHSAIEHARLETENAILRSDCASWKRQAQSAMADRGEIALRLAEVMGREQAMVTAIAQHEAIDKLRLAQLERADLLNAGQRMRIDELTRDRNSISDELSLAEETISKLRGECGDEN
jgi:FtsZ-binding cell division protein ZapB